MGDDHDRLRDRLIEATDHRNKIFHGQHTSRYLTREDLLDYVTDIRTWCKALAQSALAEIHYDGFARNSFQKSQVSNLSQRFKVQFKGVRCYERFIRQHMEG